MKRLLVIALFAFTFTIMGQEPPGEPKSGEPTHAEGATGEHEKAEPDIMWKWINFGILAVGLGYLMAKYLPQVFTDRTAEIQKNITEAQQVKREAEARAAQMDARLKTLAADIETFRTKAAREMKEEGERIRQETAAQIKKVEQHSALEIEGAGKIAQRELVRFSADLALKLAEERVLARLDSSREANLVDGFVEALGRQGSKN